MIRSVESHKQLMQLIISGIPVYNIDPRDAAPPTLVWTPECSIEERIKYWGQEYNYAAHILVFNIVYYDERVDDEVH